MTDQPNDETPQYIRCDACDGEGSIPEYDSACDAWMVFPCHQCDGRSPCGSVDRNYHDLIEGMDAGERAVLCQLDQHRATEDGDIIGKRQRDSLIGKRLAFRAYGRTTLTTDGAVVKILLEGNEA